MILSHNFLSKVVNSSISSQLERQLAYDLLATRTERDEAREEVRRLEEKVSEERHQRVKAEHALRQIADDKTSVTPATVTQIGATGISFGWETTHLLREIARAALEDSESPESGIET